MHMLVLPLEICLGVAQEVNAAVIEISPMSANMNLFIGTPQRTTSLYFNSGLPRIVLMRNFG